VAFRDGRSRIARRFAGFTSRGREMYAPTEIWGSDTLLLFCLRGCRARKHRDSRAPDFPRRWRSEMWTLVESGNRVCNEKICFEVPLQSLPTYQNTYCARIDMHRYFDFAIIQICTYKYVLTVLFRIHIIAPKPNLQSTFLLCLTDLAHTSHRMVRGANYKADMVVTFM
jgi:hypothetical protein